MSRTSCKAEMKFIDITALEDATVSYENGQAFNDSSLFGQSDVVNHEDYGYFGRNSFILDGSKTIMPDTPTDIAFWSSEYSQYSCDFQHNPKITVVFDEYHTSSGLTLYFNNTWPAEMRITWYDNNNEIISKVFNPDQLIYICNKQVKNYNKIEIEFLKTRFPEEYIQLQYILYGKYVQWEESDIRSAKLTEDIDITGATVSVNRANVEIVDEAENFNISIPNREWQSVQKNQEVTFTEVLDNVEVPLGKFFIKEFNFKQNIVSFELIDSVGVLDYFRFDKGQIYDNVLAGSIIADILNPTGLKYEVAEDIASIPLKGYLAIQSSREALQKVAFVCGAVIDDSRSDVIRIYKPDKKLIYIIDVDRKLNGNTQVTQDEYVSTVAIECSRYTLATDSEEIYNDSLSAGIHKISFNGPVKADTITVTGGTIVEAATNYVVVSVPISGEIIITGTSYQESKFTVSRSVNMIDGGAFENTKSFSDCTLYNNEVIQSKLVDLLEYYNLQKKVDIKFLVNNEQVGRWTNIKDTKGRNNASLIESQSIDLTGGFISVTKCRGYKQIVENEYYAGGELLASAGTGGAII